MKNKQNKKEGVVNNSDFEGNKIDGNLLTSQNKKAVDVTAYSKDANASKQFAREVDAITVFIQNLSEKYNMPFNEIINILAQKKGKNTLMHLTASEDFSDASLTIPINALSNRSLGILESAVKYLKEQKNFTYHKIAILLGRDDRNIWGSYHNAARKLPEKFDEKNLVSSKYFLPVEIFSARNIGALESVVAYLHDQKNLRFTEIAALISRDKRTVWTSYQNAKKKASENAITNNAEKWMKNQEEILEK